jgi:hypothetical protein
MHLPLGAIGLARVELARKGTFSSLEMRFLASSCIDTGKLCLA